MKSENPDPESEDFPDLGWLRDAAMGAKINSVLIMSLLHFVSKKWSDQKKQSYQQLVRGVFELSIDQNSEDCEETQVAMRRCLVCLENIFFHGEIGLKN